MNSQVQISNSNNNQPSLIFTHPTTFYYRPPNDCYHYRVICKEISNDTVEYLLNKLSKESNVQPNENEIGIEFQQNMEQENLVLNFDQKENLKCHLKKYLSQYVLEIKN
ncbi:hypothetical protein RhiirA4_463504 [Rhizophagus irregularis]|uniref:Uncharacterized protein n=1 Tax=Rhizophagus irregularis TaxID=588596 RepID=A0A2I1GN37_9GLOM|nr:hypothetical protein RhiirA4_463504 [Rhizophagus irregularis]